ncbi:hypothetical protein [Leptothoe spongobia]|uniref:Uncharacterized protein n=1 Tax=Leptothoe spongobia TAU-MAC 1115 TaxID=1967444 RepID=A0A947GIS8_9CYAN|nr:hypothetical protein [Leptothoe spongobia]MBT9316465.1 hypothetical protein [Leptothoe spongobia TAU-MAC 1115]
MIKYTETIQLPLAADQLLSYLQNITVQPYKPLSCGYIHSHELKSLPDFRLMEGVIVPPHSDGIAGYRPILMLRNPSNSYIVRGTDQTLSPQKRGTLIVLDIDIQHEVRSTDPNGRLGNWSGLVWGLSGQPLLKAEWSTENVAEMAKQEFLKLCGTIHERLESSIASTSARNSLALC